MRALVHEHVRECEHPKVRYRCSTREPTSKNHKKALCYDPARTRKRSVQLVSRYGVGNTSELMCAIRYPDDGGLTATIIQWPIGILKRPYTSLERSSQYEAEHN